ncbi:hypothetical protein ACIGXM_10965 [Kitasatospora sp. NPDC052896]|uniref:hypothetical protein n=1 Tax=Kitasatospora sp. NPDC052896 TaxID=3364061 RepID=UPI0037C79414
MRKSNIIAALLAGALGMTAYAVPASAQTTATTPVTAEVTSGALEISAPAGPVDLGSVVASSSPQTVSSQLGNVTVTDGRGGTSGWTATANAVDFTGPQNISVSAVGSSSYTSPTATVTGTATVTNSNLSPLYPPGAVQTATGVSGINSAVWNPTISLTIPANALIGTYSSTITHSVS